MSAHAGTGLPRRDTYDVVVVGAGLGGLAAAACMAKAGKQVLIVDRGTGPGGCAHSFRRGNYIFDPAIHFTGALEEGAIVGELLDALGVRDRVEFVGLDSYFGAFYPGLRFVSPPALEPMIEAHCRALPAAAREIESFLRLCARVNAEAQQMAFRVGITEMDQLVHNFPTFFRYRSATVADVLADEVHDPRARSLCTTLWPYMAVPPEQMPFTQLTAYLIAVGMHPVYCSGGFQNLADALARSVLDHGGDLLLNTTVDRITLVDGSVSGVVLDNGEKIHASAVVSNVDGRQTFEKLIGRDKVPAPVLRRLDRLVPSLSAFAVFTATTLDLSGCELGHEMFVHNRWDHALSYRDAVEGRPGGVWISFPSLVDPSLAPPGESIVIATSLMAYEIGEPWQQARARYTEALLGIVESVLPGFGAAITYIESATPETIESWTRAQRGAIYGWALTLEQLTTRRLRQETGIGGVYLAGHWTEPGAGSIRVIMSGVQAAAKVLGTANAGTLLEDLRSNP